MYQFIAPHTYLYIYIIPAVHIYIYTVKMKVRMPPRIPYIPPPQLECGTRTAKNHSVRMPPHPGFKFFVVFGKLFAQIPHLKCLHTMNIIKCWNAVRMLPLEIVFLPAFQQLERFPLEIALPAFQQLECSPLKMFYYQPFSSLNASPFKLFFTQAFQQLECFPLEIAFASISAVRMRPPWIVFYQHFSS